MSQDYNEYLAVTVLNERQYVSYRQLSRALKIHSNLAKQMLYEFHRKQTSKNPGSVHATYLVSGQQQKQQPSSVTPPASQQTNGHSNEDGEDTVMQSSPPLPSSSMPQSEGTREDAESSTETILTRAVLLVKEEQLEEAKQKFLSISGIHIYSLEPNTLNDLQVLTECNRKVASTYSSEDPLEAWKQYGTIQNPAVRRRTRKAGAPAPAMRAPEAPAAIKPATQSAKSSQKEPSKVEAKPEPTNKSTSGTKPKPNETKPATLKKQDSSIFKSFAKGQANAKAAPAKPSSNSDPADEPMGGFSEDEEDDGADEAAATEEVKVPEGKSKKEREAELAAMMEQEDEPMKDAEAAAATPAEPEEPEVTIDKADESVQKEEQKESVTVENGRRRGRRRVMKKKTVKDEDGYLVTREEPAWESFSEDEPAPKKLKGPPAATFNGGTKAAKKGGKPGQGNIMSFFAKK